MKRPIKAFVAAIAVAAIALSLTLALPASAGAKTGEVLWVCKVGGVDETFVSAPGAAEHGITQANSRAGQFAFAMFGEVCRVDLVGTP